jgi:6-phosphogluconolactonase
MSILTFFVGTYTTAFSRRGKKLNPPHETGSQGIYSVKFDTQTRKIWVHSVAENINPTFISISDDQKKLYAISEVETFDGLAQGLITFYDINSDFELIAIQKKGTFGSDPCHVDLHPSQDSLTISNYGTGSILSYMIDKDGNLSDTSAFYQHVGKSVNEIRQQSPHAHSSTFNIRTNQLYVADLGMDKIVVYDYEAAKGIIKARPELNVEAAPGAGPRHFEWHPNGYVLYVINELNCTISVYKCRDDQHLELLQNVTTLPENFDGIKSCADIHISSDGSFLYGSNRGDSSIVKFSIDPYDFTLNDPEHFSTFGKWTRNFAISPDQEYVFVANQDTDNIVVFDRNTQDGSIVNTGIEIDIPSPVCIKFLK